MLLIDRFPDQELIHQSGHCGIVANEFADNAARGASPYSLRIF